MPINVIPCRKGTAGSWDAPKEWEKEDVHIPKDLDRGVINQIVGYLASCQMYLDKTPYSDTYWPFYQKAVSPKAFKLFKKESDLKKSPEWKFVKETYDTNDTYLKFARFGNRNQ